MEMLFMADLLPNGLHEKVMICSKCHITKSRLDVQFVKKILWEMLIGQQKKKRGMIKVMVFTLNFPFICYLSRICN